MIRLGRPMFTARPPLHPSGDGRSPPHEGAYRTSFERATPQRSRSGRSEPVDPAGSAEEDVVFRPDLHRVDAARRGRDQDPRRRGEPGAGGVHVDRSDRAGVHVAEHEVAVDGGTQSARDAERRTRDPDRAGEVRLRKAPWLRTAVVGVLWRCAAAELFGTPAVVPPFDDEVDLVVALGSVLGFPEPAGPRVEREPERVAMPERPDPSVWVARYRRPVPVEAQYLAAEVRR